MSARWASAWSCSKGMTPVVMAGVRSASAIFWARDSVRLETRSVVAPCWMRWRAARSDIFPAPTISTVLPARRAEDFAGEIDGDRGDGDGRAADLCFGADALGNGEGALQEGVERGAEGVG